MSSPLLYTNPLNVQLWDAMSEYREIINFEGYVVSDDGKVRAFDPKLMRLAKKEIADKNFCVSNASLRLVREKAAKEVAWACGIKSPTEVFQYWLDRTEFVLATSRRDIRLAGLARSGIIGC